MMSLIAALVLAGAPLTNSTDETVLGSHTFPANFFQAGKVVKGRAFVRVTSTNSTDTLTLRLRLGGTTLTGTAIVTTDAVDVANDDLAVIDFELVARSDPDDSATIVAAALANDPDAAGQSAGGYGAVVSSLDTTDELHLEVTGEWSVASEDNSAQLESLTLFEAV